MKKYSLGIENFLQFLRDAKEVYNISKLKENDADNETQDILHKLELGNNSYHETAGLAKLLRTVRQERRKAKDNALMTAPIVDWVEENERVIKSLERLLGAVRKAEKSTEGRYYNPKTDILENHNIGG